MHHRTGLVPFVSSQNSARQEEIRNKEKKKPYLCTGAVVAHSSTRSKKEQKSQPDDITIGEYQMTLESQNSGVLALGREIV